MKKPEKNKSFVFPVSTLIGSKYDNFKEVLKGHKITKGYKSNYYFTKWISWILDWFRLIEERKYGKVIESKKIEAIVGVSCLSVLERAFPYMEMAAIPGIAMARTAASFPREE